MRGQPPRRSLSQGARVAARATSGPGAARAARTPRLHALHAPDERLAAHGRRAPVVRAQRRGAQHERRHSRRASWRGRRRRRAAASRRWATRRAPCSPSGSVARVWEGSEGNATPRARSQPAGPQTTRIDKLTARHDFRHTPRPRRTRHVPRPRGPRHPRAAAGRSAPEHGGSAWAAPAAAELPTPATRACQRRRQSLALARARAWRTLQHAQPAAHRHAATATARKCSRRITHVVSPVVAHTRERPAPRWPRYVSAAAPRSPGSAAARAA